ncbi:hypothetical protein [Nocardioides houyundeii]|uniref:hypothetical protein n=1 Tax=Nocardioides houyundeii TaxID=2045452 RepID=UPI0013B38087|nr:hypothetical protein [Nocardioides houyundeii]
MSWGDVWVCGAKVRPTIDADGPQPPWVLAGSIAREEKDFIQAIHRLQNTRDSHARAVDFQLRVHTPDVALKPAGAKPDALTFEPDGLWVAVDLTPAGRDDAPRFVLFTQRVRAVTQSRRAPQAQVAGTPRPLAVIALRGRARSGASALEWAPRPSRD